jgi:hypothetical protein
LSEVQYSFLRTMPPCECDKTEVADRNAAGSRVGAFFVLMLALALASLSAKSRTLYKYPRAETAVTIRGDFIEMNDYTYPTNSTKNHVKIGVNISAIPAERGIINGAQGGHWEYIKDTKPPYTFSPEICMASCIDEGDCIKAEKYCHPNLMNWVYNDRSNKPYPRFDVSGFRTKMKNKSIIFVGSSLVRQQVLALVWTLGHSKVVWEKSNSPANCTSDRFCMVEVQSNITICYRFMGSMATQVYHEGNFTFDHHLRGKGDSSCLLRDRMLAELSQFDMAFIQGSMAWFGGLVKQLNSSSSPYDWLQEMVPTIYRDAMDALLTEVSQRTKTVFVLGQTGTKCTNRSEPEQFNVDNLPLLYGWNLASKLWDASLSLIRDKELNVQVIDARDPLMQSVHAHPERAPDRDCLHFCMNSAAINIYLDMYWAEVFSRS